MFNLVSLFQLVVTSPDHPLLKLLLDTGHTWKDGVEPPQEPTLCITAVFVCSAADAENVELLLGGLSFQSYCHACSVININDSTGKHHNVTFQSHLMCWMTYRSV